MSAPVRQLGKNRYYRSHVPVSSSFDFGDTLPGVEFQPKDWLYAPLPACAGHSQMLVPGAMLVGNLTVRQVDTVQRSIFTYSADGSLIATIEAVYPDEKFNIVGFWHLQSTSDLVVVYKQGLARIFTLGGWKLREIRLFKNPKTQTAIIAVSFNTDSLIVLFNDGSLGLFEDLSSSLLSPKPPRSRVVKLPELSTVLSNYVVEPRDIAFIRLIIDSEDALAQKIVAVATTTENDPDPKLLFFLLSTHSTESCTYASSTLCRAVQQEPGSFVFSNAVLHHSGDCIMVIDEAASALAVLSLAALRKDFASGTPTLQIFACASPSRRQRQPQASPAVGLSGLHSSVFLCAFCDILPCYCDPRSGDECDIKIIIPVSRSPVDIRTESIDASSVFYMEGLSTGLLYKQNDSDEAATMHFVRLNQDLYSIETSSEGHTGALLYQVYTQTQSKTASAQSKDKNISATTLLTILEPRMPEAVQQVLEAVTSEDDCQLQMEYLSAASFGKLFLTGSDQGQMTEQYDSIRRRLRVLNDFNRHTVGGALTAGEFFTKYTMHLIVAYYSSRGDHERAMQTIIYLYNSSEEATSLAFNTLMRLFIDVLLNPVYFKQDDASILRIIDTNVHRFPMISGIYRHLIDFLVSLDHYPRNNLVLAIINKEPVIYDKVALLMMTRNYQRAAELCLQFGIANALAYLVYSICKDKNIGSYDTNAAIRVFSKALTQSSSAQSSLQQSQSQSLQSLQQSHDSSSNLVTFLHIYHLLLNNLRAEKTLLHLSNTDPNFSLNPAWVKYSFFTGLAKAVTSDTAATFSMLMGLFYSAAMGAARAAVLDELYEQSHRQQAYQTTCGNLLRSRRFSTCFSSQDEDAGKAKDKKHKDSAADSHGEKGNTAHSEAKKLTTSIYEIMKATGMSIAEQAHASLMHTSDPKAKGNKKDAEFSAPTHAQAKDVKKHITGEFKREVSAELMYLSVCEGFVVKIAAIYDKKLGDVDVVRSMLRYLHDLCMFLVPEKMLPIIAYPLVTLLEEKVSTEAFVLQSSIYRDLYKVMDPVSRARVALRTGKAEELAAALESLTFADLEPFSIASMAAPPELQAVIMKARASR